ncbi:MAG: universal stress protein [Flavobacteriales bacterium]|nr:universal stress protein [Flavobacteriales bacterium]MBT6746785.1 universal stress protein [Flavobacteriales bacterium]
MTSQSPRPSTILVLTDFSEASYVALRYAISIAKSTLSKIHLFHVANASSIVKSDNQAAAIREINIERKKIVARLTSLVEIIETEKLNAAFDYHMGNFSAVLAEQLKFSKPDLVIIGQKKKISLSEAVNILIDIHEGAIIIISKESEVFSNSNISLALDINTFYNYKINLSFGIKELTNIHLKVVNKIEKSKAKDVIVLPKLNLSYYEKARKFISNHFNYRYNVADIIQQIDDKEHDLLAIAREKRNHSFLNRLFFPNTNLLGLINRTKKPILLLSKTNDN